MSNTLKINVTPVLQFVIVGVCSTIEINHKPIDLAKKGQEVCVKIEPIGGEAPKMYGRHFDHTDMLVSKVNFDFTRMYFYFYFSFLVLTLLVSNISNVFHPLL